MQLQAAFLLFNYSIYLQLHLINGKATTHFYCTNPQIVLLFLCSGKYRDMIPKSFLRHRLPLYRKPFDFYRHHQKLYFLAINSSISFVNSLSDVFEFVAISKFLFALFAVTFWNNIYKTRKKPIKTPLFIFRLIIYHNATSLNLQNRNLKIIFITKVFAQNLLLIILFFVILLICR